ncbi:PDZ domain-containing protein [Oryctes borbonicus]|uniref:PDZ domain-containing protein n=1 Tax=Oryctes borbonicus TaxID=1629725 RepID=A0A0T6AV99_9SCAR|nr:PDZ domain-containing protein [Oryctes borbonicus]
MTSLTLSLDNVDVSENPEHISKLFPKCRPRSDINLNPIVSSNNHDNDRTDNSTIADMNNERDDRWMGDGTCSDNRDTTELHSTDDDDLVVDNEQMGGTYKLRDSRIIEIAGGREIYSQSRSKAVRKSRNATGDDPDKKKNQKSPVQGVWELRGRCNESNKLKNSREFTETVFSSEVCSVTHHQGDQHALSTENEQKVMSPVSKMTMPGEVVVFDDIGDTWHEDKRLEEECPKEALTYNHTASTNMYSSVDNDPERVTKVIGNLPIAVYEGSPRRYGPRQIDSNCSHPQLPSAQSLLASPSVYPPRPGFPQRVICSPSDIETTQSTENTTYNRSSPNSPHPTATATTTSTFDYLYEFSETRKVLEEFFKCPPPEEENQLEAEFQDLEYELRRQASDSGNSYVGQRLAKGRQEQSDFCIRVDSPRKHMNNCNLLGLPEHDITEHENNFLDLSIGTGSSGDLGDTEVGLQVGHSRNFTLSPETTDCDSNCGDLDSEVSLMLMENELGPSSGLLGSSGDIAIPSDSLRLYSSMPVLEDGLSSGHASDTDNNNPTVMLMKRQITEIEREINQSISKTKQAISQENGLSPTKERLTASPIDIINGCSSYDDQHSRTQSESLEKTPPPPAPAPHRSISGEKPSDVEAAIKDIRLTLQRTKTLPLKCHPEEECEEQAASPVQRGLSTTSGDSDRKAQSGEEGGDEEEADTDLETDRLLGQQRTDDQGFYDDKDKENKKKGRNKEDVLDQSVLIEGVLFRARYLGSTQLVCEGQPTKTTRMMQAEEAVSRIKAPDGETQPSTEVDLFISTEKIMVLNTDLKEIMMDHALRTISYIADIGDLVVLMARRRFVPHEMEDAPKINRTPKMICHVFESEEAQFIAQSIGQAFQVAYMEFLKANGIEDHSFVKEMDYQEVLNSQEIFGDELQMFAKKEMQKEVVVPKAKGEILGVVIVESGWGSMLPTVVIANLAPSGAAARCGQLNIGDQIIAINGVSLVGLPLSTCQNYIKNSKNQTVVKLTVVPCAPVVEVKIKRPDTKYQLGFSVQNGVICSLLRGGIAERGGVRVGHRIIEINNQSVVAVPHEKIVNLLATSVGEILMKTMPTSMFRLLTGQENPVYI